MNTPIIKELPSLEKRNSTFKMIIPDEVESKIRYLQSKFPSTEWSGVLFYTHSGSFKDNDLTITCVDIFPMDLGSSAYTEYSNSPEVTAYIANNVDTLFDCELGNIHSHHQMACFFSSTDQKTLQSEGNDMNNFVSLIVNNAGTYCAAITRKVHVKSHIEYKADYEFFGNDDKETINYSPKDKEYDMIEYFMLDIQKNTINNPLSYLDARFDEIISAKKNKVIPETKNISSKDVTITSGEDNFDSYIADRDWFKRNKKVAKELPLFKNDGDLNDRIDEAFEHIVYGSIFFAPYDVKGWIEESENMKFYFDDFFRSVDTVEFNEYADFILDFFIEQLAQYADDIDSGIGYYDIIKALDRKFAEYDNLTSPNPYITAFRNTLARYNMA